MNLFDLSVGGLLKANGMARLGLPSNQQTSNIREFDSYRVESNTVVYDSNSYRIEYELRSIRFDIFVIYLIVYKYRGILLKRSEDL